MNRTKLVLVTLAMGVFGLSALRAQAPRIVWIDPRDPEKNPLTQEVIDRFRSEGITTLLFPALNEGRVDYPSNLLPSTPTAPRLTGQVRMAKDGGFETALYFQAFIHGGNPKDPSHLARLHPEWLSYTERGKALKDSVGAETKDLPFLDGFFLDPGIPRVREFLIALLTESLRELSPDWIVLDQVRYPLPEPVFENTSATQQPYGYHPIPRGVFKKRVGLDPLILADRSRYPEPPRETADEETDWNTRWNDQRRESVDTFVEAVHELLVSQYPQTHLAVVAYPDPFYARRILFQDWTQWAQRGWVDTLFLPSHESLLRPPIDLGLLAPSIQEKIGIAGSLPKGTSIGEFLADLPDSQARRGWIFFEAEPDRFSEIEQQSPPVSSQPSFENFSEVSLPAKVEQKKVEAFPKTYTAEIRALYGFNPRKPPFDRLSPEGVADKLLDLGFNAVFGGSESQEIRKSIRKAGIRRFGEYPVFVGKSYWEKDPSSRPITSEGKPYKQQSWYAPLDPHQPWLREIKQKAILKEVREEELDGIWLDFIRFPLFWEEVPPNLIETSFSSAALTSFQETTGIIPEGNSTREMAAWILENADKEWRRFRADTILEFVREVKRALKQESPETLLGAFVLPWSEEDYGNAIYRIAGQDLKGLAGLVDILSPMVYSHQLGQPPEWVHERTLQLSKTLNRPIYPIIQCFDQPTPMKPREVEEAIRQGMYAPSSGVILFSQRHLEASDRWELVRGVFREEVSPTTSPIGLSTP